MLSVTLACADYSVLDGIEMVRLLIYSMVRYITTAASTSHSCLCVDFSSTRAFACLCVSISVDKLKYAI
jgi:hypothetical protein